MVRNVCFFENLACFVFVKHPFWDSSFCLIFGDLNVQLKAGGLFKYVWPFSASCSLNLFCGVLFCTLEDVYLTLFNWFHFLICEGQSFRFYDRVHTFLIIIPKCYKSVKMNIVFPHIPRWYSAGILCLLNTLFWHIIQGLVSKHWF